MTATEPKATRRPWLGKRAKLAGPEGSCALFNSVERSRLPPQAGAGKGDTFVWSLTLPDEGRLRELAHILGRHLHVPLVVHLQGDLGAGKTTFARALIHALGYSGRVKSPTYGLLESYTAGGLNILHLDLYRIESAAETDELAIRDLFDSKSILLVEWPEKGAGFLPPADLTLHFVEDAGERCVKLQAHTAAGTVLARTAASHFKIGDF